MPNKHQMPGLRLKGEIWQIEKRCRHLPGGWLRESTGLSDRAEAEAYLIKRLSNLEEASHRRATGIHLFVEAGLKYLEEMADRSSADDIAMHLDQLFPFIGHLQLKAIHDDTLKPFIEHEQKRGLAPKSINNVIGIVSVILKRAGGTWRDPVTHEPWLNCLPPNLTRLPIQGKQKVPYSLGWDELIKLLKALPKHLRRTGIYGVNTGCREHEVCQLRWDWIKDVEGVGLVVYLPGWVTKNGDPRVVVLNRAAAGVVKASKGQHPEFVFTFNGQPMQKLTTSAWKRAWRRIGLPTVKGVLKGVHNLRHTFGRWLRAAGIPLETRKDLMGHRARDITTNYSAAELRELKNAVEQVWTLRVNTPTQWHVGNMSES